MKYGTTVVLGLDVLEARVETRLKSHLEGLGFKVLKLVTEGTSGAPDRLILRPTWSPGPPWVVECKRPKKSERLLQAHTRDAWRKRGVLALDVCDSFDRVDEIVKYCYGICAAERIDGR